MRRCCSLSECLLGRRQRRAMSTIVVLVAMLIAAASAQDCAGDFESAKCAAAREASNAMEVVHSVCGEVPFASACSIHAVCREDDEECDWFALAAHACGEFPEQAACQRLSECGDDFEVVGKCAGSNVLATDEAYGSVREMCEMHFMQQCFDCKALEKVPTESAQADVAKSCSNPLGTLSDMCLQMNFKKGPCKSFSDWCEGQNSSLCAFKEEEEEEEEGEEKMKAEKDSKKKEEGGKMEMTHAANMNDTESEEMGDHMHGAGGHMHGQANGMTEDMPRGTVAVLSTGACYNDPTADTCRTFNHPDDAIEQNIKDVCETHGISMSWMVGCNFHRECMANRDTDGYCKPFVILATLCTDMPGMAGCADYNNLCGDGTAVEQCRDNRRIPNAPTTMQLQDSIITACSDHSMPACSQCQRMGAACEDPMATMSQLCHTMPDMPICGEFVEFCSSTRNAFQELCIAKGRNFLPPMRMYFHTSIRDLILFKDWVPENEGTYTGSFLAIVLMGILAQFLKAFRVRLETSWQQRNYPRTIVCCNQPDEADDLEPAEGAKVFMSIPQAKRNTIRAILTAVVTTLEYALMLVAMTFNVGLFLAVIAGFALGVLIFGHWAEAVPDKSYKGRPLAKAIGNDCCGSV